MIQADHCVAQTSPKLRSPINSVRSAFAVALTVAAISAIAATPSGVVATQQQQIMITAVVSGLDTPWAMAFLPDGRWLVTEREGRLRVVEQGKLQPKPVAGLPEVRARGQGGLMDVVAHPRFDQNGLIYWSYSAGASSAFGTEVARGRLSGSNGEYRVDNVEVIFRQQPKVSGGRHFGSRLVWDRQGKLFITLGDRGDQDQAQDKANHIGTIVRVTDSGGVPPDNPFAEQANARAETFSFGNRNVQGAAINPATGELWAHEHGPQGGDEVNIIRAGRNYGWPIITYGVNYGTGTRIGEGTEKAGMEQPLWKWVPSIAPCGMAFYTGDRLPEWRGDLFVGALREAALVRLTLDGDRIVAEERIKGVGRVRDVRQGPDGNLYVVSESEGAILRIEPAAN